MTQQDVINQMSDNSFKGFIHKTSLQLASILQKLSEASINYLNLNSHSIMLDFKGNKHFELALLKDFSFLNSDSDFEVKIS